MTWQWIWQRDRQVPESAIASPRRTVLQNTAAPAFATLPYHVTTPIMRAQPRIPCSTLGMP
ncbi:MAG: hypothetical protein ACREU7_15020 [Burkholderiales bacterium]